MLRVVVPRPPVPAQAAERVGTGSYGKAFVQFLELDGAKKVGLFRWWWGTEGQQGRRVDGQVGTWVNGQVGMWVDGWSWGSAGPGPLCSFLRPACHPCRGALPRCHVPDSWPRIARPSAPSAQAREAIDGRMFAGNTIEVAFLQPQEFMDAIVPPELPPLAPLPPIVGTAAPEAAGGEAAAAEEAAAAPAEEPAAAPAAGEEAAAASPV